MASATSPGRESYGYGSAGNSGKVSIALIEQLRAQPVFDVINELCIAGRESRQLHTPEFKKLVAYLMEIADGRDRREPWTTRAGEARPVPRLRLTIEKVFGTYADLHWFKVNKVTNGSGQLLKGLFPRMAAGLSRLGCDEFAQLIDALLAPTPDAAVLNFLQDHGGKVQGLGLEVFSRMAFTLRRDLFFVIPKEWGESSGCLKYIGSDLRRYCSLCRNLREVCDELGFPEDIRGSLLLSLLERPVPPPMLLEALHKAVGPSLARYRALEPSDAYEVTGEHDESILPMDFAASSIRARRGRRDLRQQLLRAYGDRCALTGNCLRDLLEVAYVLPYPNGELHAPENAILLRADLHTLWDLNLIGIEPKTMQLAVAPALVGTTYEKLAGRTLLSRIDGTTIALEALRERWSMFSAAHPNARRDVVTPSAPAAGPERAQTRTFRPSSSGSLTGRGANA